MLSRGARGLAALRAPFFAPTTGAGTSRTGERDLEAERTGEREGARAEAREPARLREAAGAASWEEREALRARLEEAEEELRDGEGARAEAAAVREATGRRDDIFRFFFLL